MINALKELKDKYKLDYAEIDFNKKIESENNEKIKRLKEKLKALKNENEPESKKPIGLYIFGAILVLIAIILLVAISNKVFGVVAVIIGILYFVYIAVEDATEISESYILYNLNTIQIGGNQ